MSVPRNPTACCDGQTTTCCPGVLLPDTLNITFENVSGCSAMNMLSDDLIADEGSAKWFAQIEVPCPGDSEIFALNLKCGGDGISAWDLLTESTDCLDFTWELQEPASSCSGPFLLEFKGTADSSGCHCCNGPIEVTATIII